MMRWRCTGPALLLMSLQLPACQAKLSSSRQWPHQTIPNAKLGPVDESQSVGSAEIKSELAGVSLMRTGNLYSIANPKVPAEKCWYLSSGEALQPAQTSKNPPTAEMRPLTQKSMSTKALRAALEESQVKESGWRDGVRVVLAACGVAAPVAGKMRFGALAMAVCGAGGLFAEKITDDKIVSASKADDLLMNGQDAQSGLTELKVLESIENALKGRVGDGSMDCNQALAAVKNSTPK